MACREGAFHFFPLPSRLEQTCTLFDTFYGTAPFHKIFNKKDTSEYVNEVFSKTHEIKYDAGCKYAK